MNLYLYLKKFPIHFIFFFIFLFSVLGWANNVSADYSCTHLSGGGCNQSTTGGCNSQSEVTDTCSECGAGYANDCIYNVTAFCYDGNLQPNNQTPPLMVGALQNCGIGGGCHCIFTGGGGSCTDTSDPCYGQSTCCPVSSTNGACGSASGGTFASLTSGSANLCANGTIASFAGSGPWTWGCNSSDGGSNTTATACSASKAPVPTCTSSSPQAVSTSKITGTFQVCAYGVSSNVTAVSFPTWGNVNGQNDLVWYAGTNLGQGKWCAAINMANHVSGNPEYGLFNVHVYMSTLYYNSPPIFCNTANFYRIPPPTNVGATCTANGNGTDTLSMSWTLPSDYTYAGPRAQDTTGIYVYPPTADNYLGTSISSNSSSGIVPGRDYNYWVHTWDHSSGAVSDPVGTPLGTANSGGTPVHCPNPPPAPSLTVNTAFGSASNGGSVYTHGYNDIPNLTWSSPNATSCSLISNNGDSKTGLSGSSVAANALGNDSGSGKTWTYTLSCSGPGGSASQSVSVVIPPAPTGVSATCPAPGTAATFSWTAPVGYTHFYVRNIDLASASVPVYYNEDFTGNSNPTLTTYAVPNGYLGSYNLVSPIVNHNYSMWIHSRAPNGAYSISAGTNYSCAPAVCPSGSVTLSTYNINIGQLSTASAPSGWSGGTFSSSNSGVASVSGSTVTGVSTGTVQVSGSGWSAPGGATSCILSNSLNVTVNPIPKSHIVLTPSSFTFSGTSGGATPAGQTMNISNTGSAALNWTASGVPGKAGTWCHISSASGSIAAGANVNTTISVDSPSTVGSFTDCGIRISDGNADNNPQDAGITYTVAPPTLTNLTFSCPSPGTNMHLAWNALAGIDYYQVRIDNLKNPWNSGCVPSVNPGDHCNVSENVTNTFYDFASESGASYSVWVFSFKNGVYSTTYINPNPQSCGVPALKSHIVLTPSSFTFNGTSGGATPAGQTMNISNTGSVALNWTASGVPGKAGTWCHISSASGSIAIGGNANVTISVDSPSTVGSFTDCGIRISDGNADNNPQDAGITYNVTSGATPTFSIQPNSRTIQVGQTATFSAIYDPDGSGPQASQDVTSTANWGPADTADCSAVSNAVVTKTGNGQYTGVAVGNACVQASYSGLNSAAGITVSVVPKSHIVLTPSSFTFSGTSGGATPAGQTMNISNTGSAALNWTASGVPGKAGTWCHISSASGSIAAGANVNTTISVDSPSNVGSFTDCGIRISDGNADNNPQDAGITYNVTSGAGCDATPGANYMKGCVFSGTNFGSYIGPTSGSPTASGNADTFTALPMYDAIANSGGNTASQTVNFSVRWKGAFNFSGGTYNFSAGSDDGEAVYIDGAQVWTAAWVSGRGYTEDTFAASISAGSHTIIYEYNQSYGGAAYSLAWAKTGGGGGSGPATMTLNNSSCGQVLVSWSSVSGASYTVYRYQGSSLPGTTYDPRVNTGAPDYVKVVYTGSNTSYPDTGATPGNVYYYWVTATTSSESKPTPNTVDNGNIVGQSAGPTACTANLGDSDKDIVAVNDNPAAGASSPCNSTTNPLPSTTVLKAGDKLKFQINLCNDNGTGAATLITVTDTMINLVVPTTGWNAQYCNGGSCASVTPAVSGTAPNQTLTFNLTAPPNNIAKGAIANITFEAILKAPNVTGSTARFQNSFNITYNGGPQLGRGTPLLPFFIGNGPPTIIEIP
jgi:GBS Bsp-like repeat/Viral BACON domain